jgi:GTP cyclohydrolase III
MALTASLSQKELERVAQLAYEGYAVRVSLANDVGATLDAEDTVAAWDALKVSGSGYADFRRLFWGPITRLILTLRH